MSKKSIRKRYLFKKDIFRHLSKWVCIMVCNMITKDYRKISVNVPSPYMHIGQPRNRLIYSVDQSINQSISSLITQTNNDSLSRPIYQSINQFVNHSNKRSINRSLGQSNVGPNTRLTSSRASCEIQNSHTPRPSRSTCAVLGGWDTDSVGADDTGVSAGWAAPAGAFSVNCGATNTHLSHITHISKALAPVSSTSTHWQLRSSGSSNYIRPRTRTKFGDRAFSVAGPVIWNSIPESIRAADNAHTFKRLLKTHF